MVAGMTVVPLRPPKRPQPEIWQCQCGCQNFWLYADGRIECAECNRFHDSMTGSWQIIDPTGPVSLRERQDDGTIVIREK